jgi:hypothetical protein
MAKKSAGGEDLIREAVERALADTMPRKLHGTKANPGIFLSSTAAAKAAAQRCLELGLIEQRGEQKAKGKIVPLYAIAPAGVAYLLQHDPVHQLLTVTQEGVDNLCRLTADWHETLLQVQQHVAKLGTVVKDAVIRLEPPDVNKMLAAIQASASTGNARGVPSGVSAASEVPDPKLPSELLDHLRQQKRQAPLRPVDLPAVYRFARARHPSLTLGQLHDLLRRMAEEQRIRLSPFTQAMYQLPEPECAMIVGREVMYYVEGV